MALPLDLKTDLVVHWPAAAAGAAPLLQQLGARALLTEAASLRPELDKGCAEAGIGLIADLPPGAGIDRWREAQRAGFAAAAVTASGEAAEFGKLLRESGGFVAIVYLAPEQVGWDVIPAQAVLRYGVYPGIAMPDTGRAGATESVWLDANSSLIAQLRAQYPRRPAVLGYRADKEGGVPETRSLPLRAAEVALADAWSAGGRVVLSLPENLRRGLLAKESSALEAWKSLAAVYAFLKETAAITGAPLTGRSAVLCGTIEESGEILNLAFRRNLCPVALPASSPPALTTALFDVVVAANVELKPDVIENVARFALSGGAVLAAPAKENETPWWTKRGWKKLHSEEDRDLYAAGRGLLYGYRTPVFDPGYFALDLKEVAGQRSQPGVGVKNYDLRVWQADSALGALHRTGPKSVAAVLTAYGGQMRREMLVSVRGRYRSGSVRGVGAAPAPVKLMPRSGRVDVSLTQASRIAILSLEE